MLSCRWKGKIMVLFKILIGEFMLDWFEVVFIEFSMVFGL